MDFRGFPCTVFGGARRARTVDLLVANEALSQLSYSPTMAGDTCKFISAALILKAPAPLICRITAPVQVRDGRPSDCSGGEWKLPVPS
jgi:hypothetical protein